MPKPHDPFPGRPQEQTAAGVAAGVGVVTSLLAPVVNIPDHIQQDIVYLCVSYGGFVVGQGTILRWRRLGKPEVVKAVAEQAGEERRDWAELPARYGGLVLGGAGLAVALAALILLLL